MRNALPRRRFAVLLPLLAALFVATPARAQEFSASAKEVLRLVNVERANAGLAALVEAPELDRAAQKYSQSMADLGFFSHTGPDGTLPWDRMKAEGYNWIAAGENIAYGYPTPQDVMTGWMNSPGHRANILSTAYSELGIGVARRSDGTGYIYWTQDFGSRVGGPPAPPTGGGSGGNTGGGSGGESGGGSVGVAPRPALTAITPASAHVGDTVALTGSGFGTTAGTVTFASALTARIVSWASDRVQVEVPAGAVSGNVYLQSTASTSNGLPFEVLPPPPAPVTAGPSIDSLSPASGRPNILVTISGHNFSWFRGSVSFNGIDAAVWAWSESQITIMVPHDAQTGPVTITNGLGTSNAVVFTVTN